MTVEMADQVGHDVEMIAMTRPTVIAGLTGNLKRLGMTGRYPVKPGMTGAR